MYYPFQDQTGSDLLGLKSTIVYFSFYLHSLAIFYLKYNLICFVITLLIIGTLKLILNHYVKVICVFIFFKQIRWQFRSLSQ